MKLPTPHGPVEQVEAHNVMEAVKSGWTIFSDHTAFGRSCGSCNLCCTVLPVDLSATEHKPANVKCTHAFSKGCRIYARRPDPCRVWSCRWLFDPLTKNMQRPDKIHYVIDCMTDTILLDEQAVTCLQVWCDGRHPLAHRDSELRKYIERVALDYGIMTIVRWGSTEAMLLCPPCMAADGEWHEQISQMKSKEGMKDRLEELGVIGDGLDYAVSITE